MPPGTFAKTNAELSRLRHIKSRAQQFFGLVYYQLPVQN